MSKKDAVNANANASASANDGAEVVHVRAGMVLAGCTLSDRVVLFESDEIKAQVCGGFRRDNNGKKVWNDADELSRQTGLHTLHYQIDFGDCGLTALLELHKKTTTVFKMLYNNDLKHWNEEQIVSACKASKTTPHVFRAVEILDARRKAVPSATKALDKLESSISTMSAAERERAIALAKQILGQ